MTPEPTPAPPPSTHAFALASLALANAIGEHHFTERELALLHVLRQLSFGSGRCGALIPKLKFFLPIGITEGNASILLKNLKSKRVIEERPAGFYTFILPVAFWKADPKRGVARAIEQLELEVVQPHLRDLLRETFVLSFAVDSTPHPNPLPVRGGEGENILPTHTVPTYGIRSDRSGPGEDVHLGATSGVTSRESAGLETMERSGERPAGVPQLPSALNPAPMNPELAAAVQRLADTVAPRLSQGYSPPGFPNREPRHKTGDHESGGSRIGNPPKTTMAVRLEREVPESGTSFPLKALTVSAGTKLLTAEPLKGARTGGESPRPPLSAAQCELRSRIEELVGPKTWANWGGAWTNAIKRDAALVERVVAQFQADNREGRIITNPGGWMWDLLKRWQ